jgi:hypothetical protein
MTYLEGQGLFKHPSPAIIPKSDSDDIGLGVKHDLRSDIVQLSGFTEKRFHDIWSVTRKCAQFSSNAKCPVREVGAIVATARDGFFAQRLHMAKKARWEMQIDDDLI